MAGRDQERHVIIDPLPEARRMEKRGQLFLGCSRIGHACYELEERGKKRRMRCAFRHLQRQHLQPVGEGRNIFCYPVPHVDLGGVKGVGRGEEFDVLPALKGEDS